MTYKCINTFSVPMFDDDGNETEGEMIIEADSVWKLNNNNYIDGENHLDNEESGEWLEISNKSLQQNFVLLGGDTE